MDNLERFVKRQYFLRVWRTKKMAEKKERIQTPGELLENIVFEQSGNQYVIFDLSEGKFLLPPKAEDIWDKFYHQDRFYVPLPRLPWPSASVPKRYDNETELWKEIRQFIWDHVDLPHDTDCTCMHA